MMNGTNNANNNSVRDPLANGSESQKDSIDSGYSIKPQSVQSHERQLSVSLVLELLPNVLNCPIQAPPPCDVYILGLLYFPPFLRPRNCLKTVV